MPIISVSLYKRPRKSWYSIYSVMLSPEDKHLQDAVSAYNYADFLYDDDDTNTKIKQKLEKDALIKSLLYYINKGQAFASPDNDRLKLKAAGIIARLMFSMKFHGMKYSLSKAVFAFTRRFADKEREGKTIVYNLSRSEVQRYYKDRYDVIHLCAAFSLLNPDTFDGDFKEGLNIFIALSSYYYNECSSVIINDTGKKTRRPLVDASRAYAIDPQLKDAIDLSSYELVYPKEKILHYLEGYSQKTRGKKYPDQS